MPQPAAAPTRACRTCLTLCPMVMEKYRKKTFQPFFQTFQPHIKSTHPFRDKGIPHPGTSRSPDSGAHRNGPPVTRTAPAGPRLLGLCPCPATWATPGAPYLPRARLLIAGQAPGTKVHETGIPFNDASGDRLRAWLGMDRSLFYDTEKVAIVPMGLCYPGVLPKGGDRPPRPECAPLWRKRILEHLPNIRLTLLVGSYAQNYVLGKGGVFDRVMRFEEFCLPTSPSPIHHGAQGRGNGAHPHSGQPFFPPCAARSPAHCRTKPGFFR